MTRMSALLVLAASLALVAASQLILKARLAPLFDSWQPGQAWMAFVLRALSDPYLWTGGLLVLVGGVCWYIALAKLPLSLMLPASSLLAPTVSIGAYYFFGESLSFPKIMAIGVIMIGVAWLGWLNA